MLAINDVPLNIGRIVTNLQTLELMLRLFLDEIKSQSVEVNVPPINYAILESGDFVKENFLTNYFSLGQLVKEVNAQFRTCGFSEQIDGSFVNLRDSIAHGRVLSLHPDGPFKILKFSEPRDGKVKVETSIEITNEWASGQIDQIYNEMQKIIRISQSLGLKTYSEN